LRESNASGEEEEKKKKKHLLDLISQISLFGFVWRRSRLDWISACVFASSSVFRGIFGELGARATIRLGLTSGKVSDKWSNAH
jgi:hypothetical protein